MWREQSPEWGGIEGNCQCQRVSIPDEWKWMKCTPRCKQHQAPETQIQRLVFCCTAHTKMNSILNCEETKKVEFIDRKDHVVISEQCKWNNEPIENNATEVWILETFGHYKQHKSDIHICVWFAKKWEIPILSIFTINTVHKKAVYRRASHHFDIFRHSMNTSFFDCLTLMVTDSMQLKMFILLLLLLFLPSIKYS